MSEEIPTVPPTAESGDKTSKKGGAQPGAGRPSNQENVRAQAKLDKMRNLWISSPVKPLTHVLAKEFKISKKWLAERIKEEDWDSARDAYEKQRLERTKEVKEALAVPLDVVKDNQDKINKVCNLAIHRVASALRHAADPDGQVRSKLAIKNICMITGALKDVTASLKVAGLLGGNDEDDSGARGLLDPKALTLINLTLNDPKLLKLINTEPKPGDDIIIVPEEIKP
jgi:hypothetical protein